MFPPGFVKNECAHNIKPHNIACLLRGTYMSFGGDISFHLACCFASLECFVFNFIVILHWFNFKHIKTGICAFKCYRKCHAICLSGLAASCYMFWMSRATYPHAEISDNKSDKWLNGDQKIQPQLIQSRNY